MPFVSWNAQSLQIICYTTDDSKDDTTYRNTYDKKAGWGGILIRNTEDLFIFELLISALSATLVQMLPNLLVSCQHSSIDQMQGGDE